KKKKSGGFAENAAMFILGKNRQRSVLPVAILKVSINLGVKSIEKGIHTIALKIRKIACAYDCLTAN
ncbi:MAG: hypothetical protein J7J51_03950, partial [Candidatus Omnitrophica bacterium]|nr:hypothetical protein [Candidatus Omnitrophota bacterium]